MNSIIRNRKTYRSRRKTVIQDVSDFTDLSRELAHLDEEISKFRDFARGKAYGQRIGTIIKNNNFDSELNLSYPKFYDAMTVFYLRLDDAITDLNKFIKLIEKWI